MTKGQLQLESEELATGEYLTGSGEERMGPASRLAGIIFSPGETFEDISRKPTLLTPVLIAVVLSILSGFVANWRTNPDWDRILREQFQRQGRQISEADLQRSVEFTRTLQKFSPLVTPVFALGVLGFLSGVFFLGMLLIQAQTGFKKILSVIAWSTCAVGTVYAKGFVYSLVETTTLLLRAPETVDSIEPGGILATNPAAVLPSDLPAAVLTVASSLDVFTIWLLILLTIGLARISGGRKKPVGKTAALVFGSWVIWVMIKVSFSLVMGG